MCRFCIIPRRLKARGNIIFSSQRAEESFQKLKHNNCDQDINVCLRPEVVWKYRPEGLLMLYPAAFLNGMVNILKIMIFAHTINPTKVLDTDDSVHQNFAL